VGTPLGCALWYRAWRRAHPDARREARQRRRQAAARAERALHAADLPAPQIASVVIAYLQERLDLAGAEPTPAEVERFLHRLGVGRDVRQRWSALLAACDAARFGATEPRASESLISDARHLIRAVEGDPCVVRLV